MAPRDKKNGGGPAVHLEACRERHEAVDTRVGKIELAMFGEDGRGGIVADIGEIKTKLQIVTSIVRTVIIPIVLPIGLALIGFWIGVKLH